MQTSVIKSNPSTQVITDINPALSSGYISSNDDVYANARSGSGLSAYSGGFFGIVANQLYYPPSTSYYGGPVSEHFDFNLGLISFDTSSLIGTITSAILHLAPYTIQTIAETFEARLYDYGTLITTSDFVSGSSLSSKTLLATRVGSSMTLNAYNAFTDVAMIPNINRSGFTRMLICLSTQRTGTQPSSNEGANFNGPNGTFPAGLLKPKLVVTTI